ncbi:hypothetical protein BDP27DRAFT_1422817 [Rhodocollybia butyracea]|uniref:Uncharacterized protein n=1 Tax=Rhodocollybia butyracea TaxID=206335 RepID=A0A9P5PKN0_9AGAR|nr:hypothetical protein BDP27DRAFT_1422817 [Rhodocollybia butyracea]
MEGSLGSSEELFERIGRAVKRSSWATGTGGEKIQTAVIDHGNPGMMHGSKASMCLGCKDDEEVVKKFVDMGSEAMSGIHPPFGFVLIILMSVRVTARANPSEGIPWHYHCTSPPTAPTPKILSTLLEISTHLQTIHSSLPARSALLLSTGHSDPLDGGVE